MLMLSKAFYPGNSDSVLLFQLTGPREELELELGVAGWEDLGASARLPGYVALDHHP